MTSKNMSVSLRVLLQGSATKEFAQQLKSLRSETSAFTDVATKANTEVLKLAAGFKLAIAEGKGLASVLGQLSGQSTLLGGRSRTLASDINVVNHSLQQGARDAERMRRELDRLGGARPPRPLPPNGGGSGGVGTGSGWGGAAMGIGSGAVAGYAIVRNPLERARTFETQIFDASTSITGGYKNMTDAQVRETNLTLAKYAKDAVRQGHGTVEGIGDSAGILAASGQYQNVRDLKEPLKAIAKTAFAAGAVEQDIALLTQQIKQFGVEPNRTQAALSRATASGFAGGFELKDMARLLPEVLAMAKTAGYSGEKGLNTVTTHLQLARKYSGIPSQAADNMRDLYLLFSQEHFKRAIGQYIIPEEGDPIKKIGLRGNRKGFDMTTYLERQKEKGIGTVDATVMLMNRQISKNKRFVELQKQIADLEEKKQGNSNEAIQRKKEAAEIVSAGEFGKIFHNQQSLLGLMSVISGMNNGEFKRIDELSWNGVDAVGRVAGFKGEIEPAQAHALQQESILATVKVYDSLKGTLGTFEAGLQNTMEANQALTASAYAAATALGILTAAKIGKAMLGGAGISLGGAAAGAGLGAAIVGVGRMSLTALLGAGKMGLGAAALGVGGAGYLGYQAGDKIVRPFLHGASDGKADDWIGEKVAWFLAHGFGNNNAQEVLKINEKLANMPPPNIQVNVSLDSQQIASSVETQITRQARRE
ncbi:phage tail tape measure protein [Agitococcus lubricus]|uniref:Minor tail protein n=1 Tax=Agitococcus lubricus TaxID=1077255 RepID=A0A2T5J3T6_9GAMM|nr:phage tail tape measure protein [Agitococcus lubricus]PTQ91275.1 minor tail protein [Agitococcus lubricus]